MRAECFGSYFFLRYLVGNELISDKCRPEFQVDRANFNQLHDSLQFLPVIRTANRIVLDSCDAHLILFRRLGGPSGHPTAADFQVVAEARSHASSSQPVV
jgi:hypothetical protein